MKWIYGIVCLGFLVFFHELGHFLAAKLFGVKVESFSLGFGPALLHKTIGGTDYRLSLLPLGGYCGMKGERDFQAALDSSSPHIEAERDSLYGVNPLGRALIGFAGPFFNALFAFAAFSIIAMTGYTYYSYTAKIKLADEAYPEVHSPAREAGLKTGDTIVSIGGKPVEDFSDIIGTGKKGAAPKESAESSSTGVPVYKITEEESSRLLKMEDELHKRVIGQEHAIKALARSIRRTRAGLKDPNRPGGSFIFAGPTGVGKTELAKALAEFLFGDQDALITLDMSEYQEKHTVSRLFGAPPGYVGYEEGGQLTEKVRRKPFSVVLFDEVEKAHADLFNSLLQILEDGRLTDSQGRVVDFKNTVIIMTTNLGSRDVNRRVPVGFQAMDDNAADYERMQARVMENLKEHFRPEFLNRVDDIIVFPQLSENEILQIVDLFVGRLAKRLADQEMSIELTDAAKVLMASKGYDPAMGARPLRREMQRNIEDALSEKILFGEIKPGEKITVGVEGEGDDAKFVFSSQQMRDLPLETVNKMAESAVEEAEQITGGASD